MTEVYDSTIFTVGKSYVTCVPISIAKKLRLKKKEKLFWVDFGNEIIITKNVEVKRN